VGKLIATTQATLDGVIDPVDDLKRFDSGVVLLTYLPAPSGR